MYAKCGSLKEARKVFDGLEVRDIVVWSAMIAGYAQHGNGLDALELFQEMQQKGEKVSDFTFSCALKACGSIGATKEGKEIHDQILRNGFELDIVVSNSLLDMYVKCGHVDEARIVFDRILRKTVVSWGTMIAGYAQNNCSFAALELFQQMKCKGVQPSKPIFVYLLKACCRRGAVEETKLLHDLVVRSGFSSIATIGTSLIHTYAECGCLREACKVFNNMSEKTIVAWGTIIRGYIQHGHDLLALELFDLMLRTGPEPDKAIFVCILKACGNVGFCVWGNLVLIQILSHGLVLDMVMTNALIDMYAGCGSLETAHELLRKMPNRSVVSWSALIGGYAQHEHLVRAFELFNDMKEEGIEPDRVLCLCILKACSSLGQCKFVHDFIVQTGFEADVAIRNSLIDMYAKCGGNLAAQKVFSSLQYPDIAAWGAIISGLANCGDFKLVKRCLEDMQGQGLKPNASVFACVLSACSHVGAVEEGLLYFKSMQIDHGITPTVEHFACITDLLGRAGCLGEAKHLLQNPSYMTDATSWTSLLCACRTYGDTQLEQECLNELIFVLK